MARVPISELIFSGTSPVRVVPGKQVYVYKRGTETLATLYAGETGPSTVVQPLVTDSTGLPTHGGSQVWIEPDLYSFMIGTTNYPVEVPGAFTVYEVPARALASNPTAALTEAFGLVLAAGGGLVRLPPGKFNLNSNTVYLNANGTSGGGALNGVRLEGSGFYPTTFVNGIISVGRRSVESPKDINGAGEVQISNGVSLSGLQVENGSIEIYGCQRESVFQDVAVSAATGSPGLLLVYSNTFQVRGGRLTNGAVGAKLQSSHDVHFWGTGFAGADQALVSERRQVSDVRMANVVWNGCHFENNTAIGSLSSIASGAIVDCAFVSTQGPLTLDSSEAANDVRGFSVIRPWVSAKTSGEGQFLKVGRSVGVVVCPEGGGRISGVGTGVEFTGNASRATMGYPVFDAVTTPVTGFSQSWERSFESSCRLTTAAASGKTYILAPGQADPTELNINTAAAANTILKRLEATVLNRPNRTTKLRLKGVILTGSSAPGASVTVALYPITIAGAIITPGTAATEVTIASGEFGANESKVVESPEIDLPSDGNYVIGAKVSGTPTAACTLQIELQARYVNS